MAQEPEEDRLPLVEERLEIGKSRVVTGRLRVRTVTETIDDTARADLQGEVSFELLVRDAAILRPNKPRPKLSVVLGGGGWGGAGGPGCP